MTNGHDHLVDEAWITGYEGSYKIRRDGTVISVQRTIVTTTGRRFPVCGCVLRRTPNSDGYLRVDLSRNHHRDRRFVHRLVAEAFIEHNGERFVDHKDGVRTNNRYKNLEWVSYSVNNQRAADRRRGRS